jgi:hypothetical protein
MQKSAGNDAHAEFFALIERAVRIGALLPERIEDIDADNPAAVAEVSAVLAELTVALAAIEAFSPSAA